MPAGHAGEFAKDWIWLTSLSRRTCRYGHGSQSEPDGSKFIDSSKSYGALDILALLDEGVWCHGAKIWSSRLEL